MSLNAAIYDPETGQILHFLRDCTRSGNSFMGTNGRYVVGKNHTPSVRWTEDEAIPVIDPETNMQTRWEPATFDQLSEATTDRDISIIDRPDLLARLDHLRDMARITDPQIAARIALITDLPKAKVYLERLTTETRDILRIVLWLLKGNL